MTTRLTRQTTYWSDPIDHELPALESAAVDVHLVACERCRARRTRLEAATAELFALGQEENDQKEWTAATHVAARARLRSAMAATSDALDCSWRARAAEGLLSVSRVALAAGIIAAVVVGAMVLGRPSGRSSDGLFTATEEGALPISSFTPGAAKFLSRAEVCRGGGEDTERIPASVRMEVLRNYRMVEVPASQYELDYLITPDLGGTSAAENLWPERYSSRTWNAHVKDGLESLLPRLVCAGTLDLTTAQHDIAADWIAAYKKYFHSDHPVEGSLSRRQDDDVARPQMLLVSARLFER